MMSKIFLLSLVGILIVQICEGDLQWEPPREALDQSLYEEVIDPELCNVQIRQITSNSILGLRFADAGIRTPRGILTGNMVDLGNYHQCLEINEEIEGSELQGKYCMIRVPLDQSFDLPSLPRSPDWPDFDPRALRLHNETIKTLENYHILEQELQIMTGNFDTERIVISVIGVLTLLSTGYDLFNRLILKRDAKMVSVLGTSFSVYTNGGRLITFTSGHNTLNCLDGIRALAMLWVIIGHVCASIPLWSNNTEIFTWIREPEAIWLWAAHITVDTFFLLSGLLVVYASAGKSNGKQLLSNLHMFYLNRLLRMFPLLAVGVLIEASYLNRMADGPYWQSVVTRVHNCRAFWWSTLLHIHNYVNPQQRCVGQTWYLAIDVQLHILCPIVLYWVLSGKKLRAWIALATGLIVFLAASFTFNALMGFPSGTFVPSRRDQSVLYMTYYYVNTLTRGAPFFVGMIFGYLLHLHRAKDNKLSMVTVALLWACAAGLISIALYASYPIIQTDWDNQTMDNLYNTFIRPMWATGLGCLIFVCVQGYGGLINWFLSLHIWKLPARISYAMYIYHYFLMVGINSTAIVPVHFTIGSVFFLCLAHYALAFMFSFFITLLIDSPFSTLFKLLFDIGKKPKDSVKENDTLKNNNKHA